jgi:O-acetyl-ADP-ribose deacetylase (regulator of RNase III)
VAARVTYQRGGDLLQADTEALVNTANCGGVMGKGVALQFRRRCSAMFATYQESCQRGEVAIGKMLVVETNQLHGPTHIVNVPTKKHWRAPSQLSYIDAGLVDFAGVLGGLTINSVALPALGVGSGGLDWADVEARLVSALRPLAELRAAVYPPVNL